jgi:5-methyltetrahydrofolate--homocysteine methyltransferase
MGRYADLARRSGARIIGGCCGTSPEHLAAMRVALDRPIGDASVPDMQTIVDELGALTNSAPSTASADAGAARRARRTR